MNDKIDAAIGLMMALQAMEPEREKLPTVSRVRPERGQRVTETKIEPHTFRKPRFPEPSATWNEYQTRNHETSRKQFDIVCAWALNLPGWYPMFVTDDCQRRVTAVYIRHESGAKVRFRFGWQNIGRISFWCDGVDCGSYDKITIAANREPRAAAADLNRRLLVDYLENYKPKSKRTGIDSDIEFAAEFQQRVNCLNKKYLSDNHSRCHASFKMRGGGEFDLDLRGLSPDGLMRVWEVARRELIVDHTTACLTSRLWHLNQEAINDASDV